MALEMHVAAERVSKTLAMWCGLSNCIYLVATKDIIATAKLLDLYEDGFFELSFANIAHALKVVTGSRGAGPFRCPSARASGIDFQTRSVNNRSGTAHLAPRPDAHLDFRPTFE